MRKIFRLRSRPGYLGGKLSVYIVIIRFNLLVKAFCEIYRFLLIRIVFGALSVTKVSGSLLRLLVSYVFKIFAYYLLMIQQDDSPMVATLERRISEVEAQLSQLTSQLEGAKQNVQSWVDANSSLSLSAAQARAQTQSMGRGLGGALLGAKYRAARRKEAASYNAGIARNVVDKRAEIKQGKQNAQELVR